jgi:anti-sigma B factor antagonist
VVILTEGMSAVECRVGLVGGLPVVTPPAVIDIANADQLREALASAGAEHTTVVVDLTANIFCDSSGINALVRAHQRARAAGGEVRLVMGKLTPRRVFKVTGLDRVFRIFDSLPEAIEAKPPAASGAAR